MTRPSTSPPMAPIRMDDPTTEASPVDRYWDHGQSAPASSTTRSRNDLLIQPCRVIRSPAASGRAWPKKVFSFKAGLPDRHTGRGIDISFEFGVVLYSTWPDRVGAPPRGSQAPGQPRE